MNITECPNDLCINHADHSNECYECGALIVCEMNWISVKDQLPEYNEYVLAYMPTIDYHYAILEYMGKWVDNRDKIYQPDVTHWQPLPAVPEE